MTAVTLKMPGSRDDAYLKPDWHARPSRLPAIPLG